MSQTPARLRGRIAVAGLVIASMLALPALSNAATPLVAIQAPLPSDEASAPQANLLGVSCVSTSWCVAVGRYVSKSGGRALIETRNGTNWGGAHSIVLPAGASADANAVLNGVSCKSVGNCVAVGDYLTSTGALALIVEEKSGVWSAGKTSPLPAGAVHDIATTLNAVSCPAVNNCVAVGQFANSGGHEGFIIHQVGGTWTHPQVSPLPPRAKSNFITQLDGISCVAVGFCVAVGQYVNTTPSRQAMIVTEKHGVWVSSVKAELPTDAKTDPWAGLFGIDCVSYGNCEAVGVYQGPNHGQGVIVRQSHGVWGRGITAPLPPGNQPGVKSDQLLSVSCTAVGYCTAAGQFTNALVDQGVIITQAKGAWGNVTVIPHPVNAISPLYEGLFSVSCASLAQCDAVGQYQSKLGQPALVIMK